MELRKPGNEGIPGILLRGAVHKVTNSVDQGNRFVDQVSQHLFLCHALSDSEVRDIVVLFACLLFLVEGKNLTEDMRSVSR